jgi:taurine transport system substrate-binding protein
MGLISGRAKLGRTRQAILLSMMLVVALVVAACGSGGGSASGSSGTLRIAYQVIPNGDPIVKNQKWLEDNLKGVKVEWRQFDAAQDVITAMASNAVDVGLIGSTGVANAVAQGLDFEVPWIFDVEGDNEALVVKSGINSVKDLAGKTIATPFGSTTQYSLIAALKDAGVDGQVKVLDMKPPEALAAWNRGDIAGSYIWEPTLTQMKDHGGHVIISSRQLSSQGVVTADLAVVNKDYAAKNPDTVKEWLKQENRAIELIRSDPQKAADIVGKEFQIDPSVAAAQMKELIFLDGKQQLSPQYLGPAGHPGQLADTLQTTCTFLQGQKLVPSCPDKSAFEGAVNGKYLSDAVGG